MSTKPELQPEDSSAQSPSPVPHPRWWILFRLVIIVGSVGLGGRLMWLALKNDPLNPPGLSPFIAFAIAVIILMYDDMADQPDNILKKYFSKKPKISEKIETVFRAEKTPFTESQIKLIKEEVENGSSLRELARRHGFSEDDFYKWLAGEGESDASLLQQLLELKEENQRLKILYADLSLEHQVLKEISEKNSPNPGQ